MQSSWIFKVKTACYVYFFKDTKLEEWTYYGEDLLWTKRIEIQKKWLGSWYSYPKRKD